MIFAKKRLGQLEVYRLDIPKYEFDKEGFNDFIKLVGNDALKVIKTLYFAFKEIILDLLSQLGTMYKNMKENTKN